ncbi:MAG TPA: hypothetical protein VJ279_14190, partial [Hanamia sp.]|nr:hypothetical protein [Hanamia sp.]
MKQVILTKGKESFYTVAFERGLLFYKHYYMELTEIIVQKIKSKGAISFCDFMEMALYYPGLGYYTSEKEKFGKKGDYYTSPGLSSLYGKMIGKQLEEMWRNMEEGSFTIVEYGAGAGELA